MPKENHLQMIQAIIERMATNSFHLKGWTITLVAALFALSASDSSPSFLYLAYFPAIAFFVLDAFYLHQEKLFRALYDHVRSKADEEIDYSMDTSIVRDKVKPVPDVLWTPTIAGFHIVIVLSILL